MTDTQHDRTGDPALTPPPEEMLDFFLAHMGQHVMAKIGMETTDGPNGPLMALHPTPVILGADGHLDFGVLGVFFDMAAANAFEDGRGGVHADIAITRLRPPTGSLVASARAARAGRRTGVVEVDLRDEAGVLVATSTQEIVFREMMGSAHPGTEEAPVPPREEMRAAFRSLFDGACRLDRSLAATLGIERHGDTWQLELADDRTNGGGALHGGCGIALVEAAADGTAIGALGPSRTLSAAVRYLAPARVGPFAARSELTSSDGTSATQRVRVIDTGQADREVMLADVVSVAGDVPSR